MVVLFSHDIRFANAPTAQQNAVPYPLKPPTSPEAVQPASGPSSHDPSSILGWLSKVKYLESLYYEFVL